MKILDGIDHRSVATSYPWGLSWNTSAMSPPSLGPKDMLKKIYLVLNWDAFHKYISHKSLNQNTAVLNTAIIKEE